MSERTFTRADLETSRRAWSGFRPEWNEARRIAAARGMLFPPAGEATDEREEPEPSQRAILWQALDFRPRSTLAIIGRSSSWSAVVRAVLAEEGRLREDAGLAERQLESEREGEPSRDEAAATVGDILGRLR